MLVQLVIVLICLVFAWWCPHFLLRLRFWKKYRNTGKRLPPFVPFSLPFFGHSLQLRPAQEPFVLRNHKKYGPVFGCYMQDLPFFFLDISNYAREVNSSPKVERSSLPPSISPLKAGFPKTPLFPILRGTYTEQLKLRLPFIQKQMENFLRSEFPDPTQTYTRDNSILHSLTSCFTLASWCNLEFTEMQKYNAITKLCDFSNAENSWRDVTLVMPRLAFLARLSMKKYGKIVESFIVPLLMKKEVQEAKSLLHIISYGTDVNSELTSSDEIIDNMIMFLPGAMSISPSVKHIFSLLLKSEFLSQVEEEVYQQDGNDFTSTILNKMKYLDAAIKETLRLEFTLASFRYVTEDIILHDGVVLPANSHFILTGSAINYDETLFPNSHSWNPQRWIELGESQKGLKFSERREAFIWGSGKVICPGQSHANIGMKLITSLLLRYYSCRITSTGQFTFKTRTYKDGVMGK